MVLNRLKQLISPEDAPPENPEDRLRLATCVVLLEVAYVDEEFTADERSHLLETLREEFGLDTAEAESLLKAGELARDGSIDLWQFTHSLNQHMNLDEKARFMDQVWRVICADGMLDAHEDHLVHRLAKLLNMTHHALIESKLRVLKEVRGG